MPRIDALVLETARPEAIIAFYRALGVPLAPDTHGGPTTHWECDHEGVHFGVFPREDGDAVPRGHGGATMVGFAVADVEGAVAAAVEAGGTVVVEVQDVPWGRRAVLADPDGRPVELNQG